MEMNVRHVVFSNTSTKDDAPVDEDDEGGFTNEAWKRGRDDEDEETHTTDEEGGTFEEGGNFTDRLGGRKRRQAEEYDLKLSFTRWREAVVVVCLLFYVSDLLLDAWVLRTFVLAGNIQQAWFMGFCMLVPNLYAGYKSLQWYLRAHQDHPVSSPVVWLIRVLFFPISLVLRYYDALRRGYRARAAERRGDAKRQRLIMEQFVSESAEVAMLRLFVIFLEDAPICVLNLMLVFTASPDEIDYVGFSVGVVVAKLSCSISLGVLHYAAVTKVAWHAYHYTNSHAVSRSHESAVGDSSETSTVTTRTSRRGRRQPAKTQEQTQTTTTSNMDGTSSSTINSTTINTNNSTANSSNVKKNSVVEGSVEEFHRRANLSPLAHVLFYCWQFTTIGSRLVCYALFASVFMVWLVLLAAVRWVINTVYILVDVRTMSLANCASFGGVYLFTFVSTSTDKQYIRLALYYAVNCIEAIAVSVVWWNGAPDSPYHVMGLGLLVGGTAMGIVFMLVYYTFGHPNKENTWGRSLIRKRKNVITDSDADPV